MRRRLPAIALIWLAADAAVHACPVCFQFEDSATTAGVRAALIVLLSVTVAVLAAVAAWCVTRGPLVFSTDPALPVPEAPSVSSATGLAGSVENANGPV